MRIKIISGLVILVVILIWVWTNFGNDITKFYKQHKQKKEDDTRTQDKN